MPKMYDESFPYPQSGVQPKNSDKLNPPNGGPASIPGGVNDIYLPDVPRVANTDIYLKENQRISGGANNIYIPDNKAI